MSNWEQTTIGEILRRSGGSIKTGPFGTTLKAAEYTTLGVPLISVKEIGYGDFRIDDKTPRVGKAVVDRLPEYLLHTGDIVFGRKGAVDRAALVTSAQQGWFLGSDGIRLRLPKECDPRFARYWISSSTIRNWLHQHSTGSTMPSLNQGTIARIPINLPPLHEQYAISACLGSLDDKIELNRQMNDTLEAMAQAIFRDWFVDFGPTRRKIEGPSVPVEIMGGLVTDAERAQQLADLFPAKFGDNGLPEGWNRRAVGEDFEVTMGQSPPGSTYNEVGDGLPFFQGRRDFGFRFPENRVYCSAPTRIAERDWTLISVRAPVGDINRSGERCCIGRGVGAIVHRRGLCSFTYYAALELKPELARFDGDGTVFGSINQKQLKELRTCGSDQVLAQRFDELIQPLDQLIRNNSAEMTTLAATRDLLLPKLMSGEVRLQEADEALEAAQ